MRNCQPLVTAFQLLLVFFASALAWQTLGAQGEPSGYRHRHFNRAGPRRGGSNARRVDPGGNQNRLAVSPKDGAAGGTWTLIGPQPLVGPDGKS